MIKHDRCDYRRYIKVKMTDQKTVEYNYPDSMVYSIRSKQFQQRLNTTVKWTCKSEVQMVKIALTKLYAD